MISAPEHLSKGFNVLNSKWHVSQSMWMKVWVPTSKYIRETENGRWEGRKETCWMARESQGWQWKGKLRSRAPFLEPRVLLSLELNLETCVNLETFSLGKNITLRTNLLYAGSDQDWWNVCMSGSYLEKARLNASKVSSLSPLVER